MSAYSYVDNPNSNLSDRHPFVDPVTTTTCSHTFCYECILGALSHAPQCPVDRSPLTPKELGPADSIVRALVDELAVECTHREEGCTHVCQRQLLPAHLREECAYSEVLCPESDCEERMLKKDVNAHTEDKHKGRARDKASSEEIRKGNSNSERQSCPQSHNGCLFSTMEMDALSDHITSCPFYGIKEFLEISAARHASLLEQNVLLRHRVVALETSVQVLRREMETVRRVLGPWFRAENSNHTAQTNVASSSPIREGSNQSELATTESVRDPSSGTDTLASYFLPQAAGAPSQQMSDATGRHRRAMVSSLGHMNQGLHESYPMLGYHPMRSPLMPHVAPQASTTWPIPAAGDTVAIPQLLSMIAPLDLGNSLEGTLTGLRDSVLTLAAGVDSLGRRSEIAVTNESLRFGEETMSLRASIHGLRMQVHAMMMERNAQMIGRSVGDDSPEWMILKPSVSRWVS
ncbi:hypothetical protein JOM56_002037 [Amanita muscaria]